MVKSELVKQIALETHITQEKSATIINLIFGKIRSQVLANKPMKISGFGVFFLKDTGDRLHYIPKLKKSVLIGPRKILAFKPSINNRAVHQH